MWVAKFGVYNRCVCSCGRKRELVSDCPCLLASVNQASPLGAGRLSGPPAASAGRQKRELAIFWCIHVNTAAKKWLGLEDESEVFRGEYHKPKLKTR